MSGTPAGPDRSQPREPDAGGDERDPASTQGDERYGPLRLLRTTKADGRALILFSRAERPRA